MAPNSCRQQNMKSMLEWPRSNEHLRVLDVSTIVFTTYRVHLYFIQIRIQVLVQVHLNLIHEDIDS